MSRPASAKTVKSGSIKLSSRRPSIPNANSERDKFFPSGNTKIRPKTASRISELERTQSATREMSKEEKQKRMENQEAEIRKLELESQDRKRSLQELDVIRDEILGNNQDVFAEEKAAQEAKLLNRAEWAKHEQVTRW